MDESVLFNFKTPFGEQIFHLDKMISQIFDAVRRFLLMEIITLSSAYNSQLLM